MRLKELKERIRTFMVNEERLHYMVKMARFDANDRKSCQPMMQYTRRDYISLQLLKSFVTGSAAFGLILTLWGIYSIESLLSRISSDHVMELLIGIGILYAVFLISYLLVTYVVYSMKYTRGRQKVKKYYHGLKKVNALYDREERLKRNSRKE